jgi:hypothetical protein
MKLETGSAAALHWGQQDHQTEQLHDHAANRSRTSKLLPRDPTGAGVLVAAPAGDDLPLAALDLRFDMIKQCQVFLYLAAG